MSESCYHLMTWKMEQESPRRAPLADTHTHTDTHRHTHTHGSGGGGPSRDFLLEALSRSVRRARRRGRLYSTPAAPPGWSVDTPSSGCGDTLAADSGARLPCRAALQVPRGGASQS